MDVEKMLEIIETSSWIPKKKVHEDRSLED